MGLGSGFWPATWFVSGVLEVFFSPGSPLAWVFLSVSTIYLGLKMFQKLIEGDLGLVLGVLTSVLWVTSLFLMF